MEENRVVIATDDGECSAYLFQPGSPDPAPGVIMYMDGLGIRPGLIEVASKLRDEGFCVLLPDLYYRFGTYDPLDPHEVMAGDFRAAVGPMMATTNNFSAALDTAAFVAFLASSSAVKTGPLGAVGFCMGGGMALTVAGTYPHAFGAAASFHGGNLATDNPMSPHLVADKIGAEVYVAGASNDTSYPPEMAERLEDALEAAGVTHRCEIYEGAAHGWMMPDFPVFNPQAADRGWSEMVALLKRAL